MLNLSRDYVADFPKFLLEMANGHDTEQTFRTVYHKELNEVMRDLQAYAKSDRLFAEIFNLKLEKSAENPDVSAVDSLDSGLVLADLLALTHKSDEARQAYGQLVTDHPDRPEAQESLGYLALQTGDSDSARQYFSGALQAGTKDPQMCFDYAMLSLNASAGKDGVAGLRRAVELKPDYLEARLQLGLALTDEENYAEALEQFHQIKKVNADQAPSYFLALSYADYRTGHIEEARQNAEAAKKWAKTPADSDRASSILQALDTSQGARSQEAPQPAVAQQSRPATQLQTMEREPDSAPPTLRHQPAPTQSVHERIPRNPFVKPDDQMAHVEGEAQSLDCAGESARFHVRVGQTAMVFEIPDPTNVLIKHSGEVQHDFACGVQKPFHVAIDYAVKSDPKRGTAGIVRELDF
jgi:tetratricopeptide (TPR) repeat protein